MSFRDYVERVWLPNHQMELPTRQRYTTTIIKRLIPEFGSVRMIDILPAEVRAWVRRLTDEGISPNTIASSKTILSAIFHHRAHRVPASVPWSQDSPGTKKTSHDRDSGTVRDDL